MTNFLKRAEWIVAVFLSAMALFLLIVRVTHAGPLWRDECAVVNLARMSSLEEIARDFQHEAFPLPFPILVRLYTDVFGTSDAALRALGFVAGLAVLGAIWFSASATGRGPPLIALALLGLNTTFLFWGTTLRGYALGSALIIITFGLFAALITEPTRWRTIGAAVVSIAAVQSLVHNLALIAALTVSAGAVSLFRHDFKRLITFLGILALCFLSFLPYLSAYSNSWSQVVEFPVTPRLLWNQFNFALGNPHPVIAFFWHVALLILLGAAIWKLSRSRSSRKDLDWNLLLFASLAIITTAIAYYEFLQTLSYLTRSWYFLALVSLLAVALDSLGAVLSDQKWVRIGRLGFAVIALVVLPINAWPKILERQTNIDIVAQKISQDAKPADLIVIAPWQYGISFNRYYHGATPQITLPSIVDLRVHRYDLFREKMLSEHPIDDVLERIHQTLANRNRVWIVGGIKLPPIGRDPRTLPCAPNANVGWDNVAYSDAWMEQLGALVRTHSEHGQNVPVRSELPINQFEDVPLLVVDGWQ